MTCSEVKNLLPGYLEQILSPEDKEDLENHLASCLLCRRDLEDLKRTADLVKDLPEVEPPPFFEQQIMARVREEAGRKKGLLRTLFYPLNIKLPIQVMTTVLVAVLAIYVFQKTQPEMRQRTPFPTPLSESDKGGKKDESMRAPLGPIGVRPPRPTPPRNLFDQDQGQFASVPLMAGQVKAERKEERPPSEQEEPLSTIRQTAPMKAEKEKEVPPTVAQFSDKTPSRVDRQDPDLAHDFLAEDKKLKGRTIEPEVTVKESRVRKAAPTTSKLMATSLKERPEAELTIQVRDITVALGEIEDRVGQAGGRIIEKLPGEGEAFLKAEINVKKIGGFLEGLKVVGKVSQDKKVLSQIEGNIAIIIKIILSP